MQHPHTALAAVSVIICSLACGGGPNVDVTRAYNQARTKALKVPGPPPANWKPDAILQLSPETVQALVEVGVDQIKAAEWTLDAPGVTLTPRLKVASAELSASKVCDACFVTKAVIKGPVKYDAGMLGKGSIPTKITATIDLELAVGKKSKGFPVTVTVRDVKKVRVDMDGLPKVLADALEPRLTTLARDEIASRLEPFEVAKPPSDRLPLRALRAVPQGEGVRLEMLTEAGTPESITPSDMRGDWTLDIAATSLVALAARESFKVGPQDLGLLGEPTALRIDKRGNLHLGLRLWRIEGNGWWRDLDVLGTAAVGPRDVQLKATSASVVDQSPGAALADPLAWLAESTALSQIEEAAEFALPAMEKANLGPTDAKLKLEGLAGGPNRIRSWGTVTLE